MKHNTEIIAENNGIELLVGYDYETSPPQIEECHGFHDVGGMTFTELTSVELGIGHNKGIDILPLLTEDQKKHIVSILGHE